MSSSLSVSFLAAWPASNTAAGCASLDSNSEPLFLSLYDIHVGAPSGDRPVGRPPLFFLSSHRARALGSASPARLCSVPGNVVRYASLSALRTRYVSLHGVVWRAPGHVVRPPPLLAAGRYVDGNMYIMFCSSRALSLSVP
ncbi:hypothetical protein GY45DRAFT_721732 [Cubamyces sp. BRFM 1775]|nr:hypothetical protein GY45DRAFT_721732 [Cubamyces sp. BRFM 1775]